MIKAKKEFIMKKFNTLMVQGTGSGVGKSLITAGLCRIFSDMGVNTAPFKAQNMALNSYVTVEDGEIGRAQAMQAEAARTAPSVYMNPILLKAAGESSSQVIVLGKVHSTMTAGKYYEFRTEAWRSVTHALDIMKSRHELLVIEGAGSPAEINLSECEIVNMAVARHLRSPVLLVGDIDRGGVFASLLGTAALVGQDAKLIKGFIINKFRGDPEILRPGLSMLRDKTGIPTLGVIPYARDIVRGLPEEDGLALDDGSAKNPSETGNRGAVRITVLRLKYISNFTDFDPLRCEPDVELTYSMRPRDIISCDAVIIPGSKNTVKDLLLLRETGVEDTLREFAARGGMLVGMCGGYQMLGAAIKDPHGVESARSEISAMGFLEGVTTFGPEKSTVRVRASMRRESPFMEGVFDGMDAYEIHMGRTETDGGIFDVQPVNGAAAYPDGDFKGRVWGTYLHGIFENDDFRRAFINGLRTHNGLSARPAATRYALVKEAAIDALAALLRENLDMRYIEELAGFITK
jgi:adenosylcobyric acid synthase